MAQEAAPQLLHLSPLEACPDTPNCVHEAYLYEHAPTQLADHVEQAMRSLKPASFERGVVDDKEMQAVYDAWIFKDDVHVKVDLHESKSIVFIRSASRDGTYDLGVNKRRVRNILKALNERLTGK